MKFIKLQTSPNSLTHLDSLGSTELYQRFPEPSVGHLCIGTGSGTAYKRISGGNVVMSVGGVQGRGRGKGGFRAGSGGLSCCLSQHLNIQC